MYKRFCILVLIAFSLASCSKEEVGEVSVQMLATITPEMVLVKGGESQPEPVIADYAVLQAWRTDADAMAAEVVQNIEPGTTQISFSGIKLAAGAEYLIYIWAGCNGYYDTHDLRSVSVNDEKSYDGKTEEFDAFYCCTPVICSQDDEVHPVTLKRPFSKLSFSAETTSSLTVRFKAPATLNLNTGEVSGEKQVEYSIDPAGTGVTAFDYIFADEGVKQMDYTFKLGEEAEKTTTVPVARNTKTNIIFNITN